MELLKYNGMHRMAFFPKKNLFENACMLQSLYTIHMTIYIVVHILRLSYSAWVKRYHNLK